MNETIRVFFLLFMKDKILLRLAQFKTFENFEDTEKRVTKNSKKRN